MPPEMQTTFLFALPSMLSGVARLLNFSGWFDSYNEGETSETADAMALYSDFRMVGQDLQKAMESLVTNMDPPVNQEQLNSLLQKTSPVLSIMQLNKRKMGEPPPSQVKPPYNPRLLL